MSPAKMLSLRINGTPVTIPLIAGETLARLIRERLGLTGTKIGCNEAECGACTVLVDGEPVLSCTYPAVRAQGKEIITIEGIGPLASKAKEHEGLHPLQQAFILYGAVQCGFCTPGQIMTAYALLSRDPRPTRESIRQAMKGTLCRCGGYPAIEEAVLAAAAFINEGHPILSPDIPQGKGRTVGRVHIRADASQKVTGEAKYTDDLAFDHMLHARVKRAGVPSAILRGLDVSRAKGLPGVRAVLTAADLPGARNHGLVRADWPILIGVGERIRYAGDAVALVAAETREIASQAIDLIMIDADPQVVINGPGESLRAGAPELHAGGNLLKHIQMRKGDIQDGFNRAEVILQHTYHVPAAEHLFMEPECSLARLTPGGQMEVYVGSQIPYSDRQQVVQALGWPEDQVRIIGPFVGGAFGGKEDIAGQIHAALLAQATGRPVKLLFDRHESMLVHPKRHAVQIRVKVGAKNDGRLTAIETELYGDTGAYASLGEEVMERATTHSTGPYEIANVSSDCFAVYSNNPPAGAYRGFGVPQVTFAMESMMDMLADRLGMDPIDLRRKNILREGGVTCTGQVLRESVGLQECIDRVEAEMKKRGGDFPFAPKAEGHSRTAWGFAVGYKNTGFGGGAEDAAEAEVEILADGRLEVRISSAEVGQGLSTVLQMIAAEEMDLPFNQVGVRLMDTLLTPDGGATTASRQTYISGNAVRLATSTLRQAITRVLAERFDLPPEVICFCDGTVQAGERRLSFSDVAQLMIAEGHGPRTRYQYQAPPTRALGAGGDMHVAYSFAAQAAEVSVDTRSGEVTVLRVITANDVGKCLNPLGLKAQAEGGVIMGLGSALMENFLVDEGVVFSDRMARYRIPTFQNTPEIISLVVEHPTSKGPYGAKGAGEIAGIPTAPAITNAIYHATGVRVDRLPAEPEVIWRALKAKEQR